MSQENVELARRMNAAFVSGDVDVAWDLVAEDVVATDLRAPLDAPAVLHGREALAEAYARFTDVFDDFVWEVDDDVDVGDWVIAAGQWVGTAKGSGARVEEPGANAVRVRDGKIIEWIFGFPDQQAALDAVRLRE